MPETPQNKAILFTNLDEWLSHLETAHPVGIDMGLVRINRVKESLGLQFHCPVITVGGTNGKGSTCAFLESILLASGYRVACHTSPHLLRFHERARIQGREATDAELLQSFNRIEQARCRIENAPTLTYFEFTTLAIMDLFANAGIDVAILEVGMGGRLDAVNIVDADCAIVTSIDLDHMAYLGNTREAIAFEKAGIIKNNIPVVIGEYLAETKPVFTTKAKETHSELYFASDLVLEDYPCGLLGDYQFYNKKTVIQTLRVLQEKQLLQISEDDIKNGFLKVIDNTHLQGRWQQLGTNPKIICDTAHNAHGLTVVIEQLKKEKYNQLHLVLGVVNDKKLDDILILLPKNAQYYFCKPNISRGLEATVLQEKAATFGLNGAIYNSVSEAYEHSRKMAAAEDFIYVGGSTFVVAEIL